MIRCRPIGNRLLFDYSIAFIYDWNLIDTGPLIGAQIFLKFVTVKLAIIRTDINPIRRNIFDFSRTMRQNHNAGIASRFVFHSRTDERRLSFQQRHSLPLHIRSHEGAVCVVIFKERDHRRCDRNDLFRRNVHIVYAIAPCQDCFFMMARRYTFILEPIVFIQRLVCLRDGNIVFLICRQIAHVFRYALLDFIHFPVRRLHEAELIDTRVIGQRTNQADVRTFWRLNRAHTSIMGIVNVAHLETCALTRKASRSKRRKAAFMCKFGQRIVLIHELRKL